MVIIFSRAGSIVSGAGCQLRMSLREVRGRLSQMPEGFLASLSWKSIIRVSPQGSVSPSESHFRSI